MVLAARAAAVGQDWRRVLSPDDPTDAILTRVIVERLEADMAARMQATAVLTGQRVIAELIELLDALGVIKRG